MQAKLFYETQSDDRSIPLYLISQSQWNEGLTTLTAAERNYFALYQFKGKINESPYRVCIDEHTPKNLLSA